MKIVIFKEHKIRCESIDFEYWYSAIDIFKVIKLSWKGGISLKDRGITDWEYVICDSAGGSQNSVFINKDSVKKLLFRVRDFKNQSCVDLLQVLNINTDFGKLNKSELIFTETIKGISWGFGIRAIPQFIVGKYRTDLFVPSLGFVEFNEFHHRNNKKSDFDRNSWISEWTGYPVCICEEGQEDLFYENFVTKLLRIHHPLIPENIFNQNFFLN